jgi:hypothetical protein
LILVCKPGNNLPSISQTIKSVSRRDLVISFPCGLTTFAQQPSGGSVKIRATVASEWLGKCSFLIVTFPILPMSCIDNAFCSAINPPSSGNTFDAYVAAAKALGSNEPAVGCSLDPHAFQILTYSLDDFSDFRQRPGNGRCGRSGDGYTCSSLGKFLKRECVEIKFDFKFAFLLVRGPPRCRWLVRSLGCGV